MIFRVEEIVSWASRDATLLPGTVIMTGTAEGIGAARDPPVYMAPVSFAILVILARLGKKVITRLREELVSCDQRDAT